MSEYENSVLFQKIKASGHVIVTDHPKLDLESYIANYQGKTRIDRLYHIGITSTYLSYDALKWAFKEAKNGRDVDLHKKIAKALKDLVPNDPILEGESEWEAKTNKQIKSESDRLEAELKGYKNNLIKESIRMGHDDLGQYYHSIGDLASAIKAYNGMRQYCISPAHTSIMHLHVIHVSIDQQNWLTVGSTAQKLKLLHDSDPDARRQAGKVSVAIGLAEMASRQYQTAALRFLATDPGMVQAKLNDPDDDEAYNEIMTPNDVAVYGGLCALASMDRKQLLSRVLENSNFRSFLELEPHIRRAITLFVSSKFSQCLSVLESSRSDLLLDLYLYPHVADLFYQVRSKAITQYFIPFSCVEIASLAHTFHVTDVQMEHELIDMIGQGKLDAKLDLEKRVLLANVVNDREKVQEEAIRTAKEYAKETQKRMLRMEILHAGLEVKDEHVKAERKGQFGLGKMLAAGEPMDAEDANGSAAGGEASSKKEGKKAARGFWA